MGPNAKKIVACVACLLVTGQTMASAQRFKRGRGPSLVEQTALNREWARELLDRQVLDALITESSSLMPSGALGSQRPGAENMAYWRGCAYWDIGLFGDAEMDFLAMQNNYPVRYWRIQRDQRGAEPYRYSRTEFMRLADLVDIPHWGDRDFFPNPNRKMGPQDADGKTMGFLSKPKLPNAYAEMPLRLWDPELRAALDHLKRLERIKPLLPRNATMLPTLEPASYGKLDERSNALPLYFEHTYYTYFEFDVNSKIFETGGGFSRSIDPETGKEIVKPATRERVWVRIPYAIGWLNQGRGNVRGGLNIYHDEDAEEDEWTQGVMSTLGNAYGQAKSSIFGSDVPLVTVFIFSDRARYDAFFKEYHGQAPKAQEWIAYNRGVMMLCPRNSQGLHIAPDDVKSDYFRSTIAQVYAHCLLRRALGTTEVPSWLNNGLAMTLASKLVPEDEKLNDYAIKRLVAANALLNLETVAKVPASTQYMTDKDDSTKGALQQSYHMTRYLLQGSKGAGVVSFFNRAVNNEQSVEQAFEETYGASPEAFHASWLANVQKTFGGALPQTPVAAQPTNDVPTFN